MPAHAFIPNNSVVVSDESRVQYLYPKQRLYPATPGRHFVCVRSYKPQQDGELYISKGQFVEGAVLASLLSHQASLVSRPFRCTPFLRISIPSYTYDAVVIVVGRVLTTSPP